MLALPGAPAMGGGSTAGGYEVVAAGSEDLDAITALYAETAEFHVSLDGEYYVAFEDDPTVRDSYAAVLRDTSGETGVLVARTLGGEVVGFVLWSIERDGYHDTCFQDVGIIEEVYVQPASRRAAGGAAEPPQRAAPAGVGTALMHAAMETMRSCGVEDFKLQASSENTGAIGFYEKLGWRTRQVLMYYSETKPPPSVPAAAAAAVSGEGQISWQVTLGVRPGQLEAFHALTEEMVALSATEPGTLVYERFLSDDGETVHAFERYASSDAAIAHLEMFSREFGDRLMQCMERQHINIYGDPSDELRAKLDATLPVGGGSAPAENAAARGVVGGGQAYLSRPGGFSRL